MITTLLLLAVVAGLLYYSYNLGLEKGYEEAIKMISVHPDDGYFNDENLKNDLLIIKKNLDLMNEKLDSLD